MNDRRMLISILTLFVNVPVSIRVIRQMFRDLSGLSQDSVSGFILLERQHELYEEGFAWF